jgi:hypothetical protein
MNLDAEGRCAVVEPDESGALEVEFVAGCG